MELKEILKDQELVKKLILSHILTLIIGVVFGVIVTNISHNKDSVKDISGVSISDLSQTSLIEKVIDSTQCDLYVEVAGAIHNPGVYCFKNGEMIVNAIEKAGGFNRDVYAFKYISREINLAELLKANLKLYIPFEDDLQCQLLSFTLKEEEKSSESVNINGTAEVKSGEDCININSAISTKLTDIPGVGPSTAVKIIDGRPYQRIEDVLNVSGIGESTFENMKDHICI